MSKLILIGIVAVAFLGRAFLIWLTRPEYVGWFNHSYFYWVQTRGLLLDGTLPYADLPLIFYGYAAIATFLQGLGMELEPAVINAARFCMSLAPALIAIPAFLTLRRINQGEVLSLGFWLLVAVAAFLPLTMVHVPELLQKNMIGMLLLFSLNYFVYLALQQRNARNLGMVAVLVLAIALTHLGSLAVTLAFGISLAAAICNEIRPNNRYWYIVAALVILVASSIWIVAIADPEAFLRVLHYAQSSLPNSLLGKLLGANTLVDSLLLLGAILVPAALAIALLRVFRRHRDTLALPDRLFWLSHILLAYLLLAPVIDLDVMPRLLLFLPLPAMMIAAYHLRYCRNKWANRLTVAAATAGTVVMLAGETTGLLMHYPHKAEARYELDDMRARFGLGFDDFILTPYGGNTICNWFLGTRSGLITAFNRDDAPKYARIFVLNPIDSQALGDTAHRMHDGVILFETERQQYEAMRLNVPVAEMTKMINYRRFDLHAMYKIPDDWLFDGSGMWIGADYSAYLEERHDIPR